MMISEAIAVYRSNYFAGKATIMEKALGRGRAIHLGSTFSRENVRRLFTYLEIREPFADFINAPQTLEIVVGEKEDKKYLVVLNFQAEEVAFLLKKKMKLLYTGEKVSGEQSFPAHGTAVYEINIYE